MNSFASLGNRIVLVKAWLSDVMVMHSDGALHQILQASRGAFEGAVRRRTRLRNGVHRGFHLMCGQELLMIQSGGLNSQGRAIDGSIACAGRAMVWAQNTLLGTEAGHGVNRGASVNSKSRR
jgi:hypothetical protein